MGEDIELKNWEIGLEMKGLTISLSELKKAVDMAPMSVKGTPLFFYYTGFLDARILIEELGGV